MSKITFRVEAVIFNSDGELLLALHKKKGKSYWVLPGGHVEFGEKMDEALKRELKEELGFQHASVRDFLFSDEFIEANAATPRHVIKAGFLVKVHKKELENVSVVAKDEAISEVRFFKVYGIESSFDKFYPSKEFLLKLMEASAGFDLNDDETETQVVNGDKA